MSHPLAALWPHWRPEWVLYEDAQLIAVDKPAGLAVYPDDDDESADVVTRGRRWLAARDGGEPYLAALHGLDRAASGVVLLSKDKRVNRSVAEQLERGVERGYLVGVTSSRRAPLRVETLERRGERRLARVVMSARSQPVRRLLAQHGMPIAGDRGGDAWPRLCLHAASMRLRHPDSGRSLELSSPAPSHLVRWLERTEWADVRERLVEACDRRYGIAHAGDTDVFRLVHGAGDELEGVELDRYGDWAVLALASAEAEARAAELLDAVASLGFAGVYLKRRPKQASVADTLSEELAPSAAQRGVDAPAPLWVKEAGARYAVRLGEGLSTGLFADQRAARRWLLAEAAGKRVLNLFCYHAAFTVAAMRGGAVESVSVDASAAALERAAENLAHAGASPALHRLVKADVFAYLREAEERFEVVILDPPSFSTTKRSRFRAARDYAPLAALALNRVAPGGRLLACTNHRGIVPEKLRRQLEHAARLAGREVLRMTELPCPTDFPPPPGQPCHLKRVRVEVGR